LGKQGLGDHHLYSGLRIFGGAAREIRGVRERVRKQKNSGPRSPGAGARVCGTTHRGKKPPSVYLMSRARGGGGPSGVFWPLLALVGQGASDSRGRVFGHKGRPIPTHRLGATSWATRVVSGPPKHSRVASCRKTYGRREAAIAKAKNSPGSKKRVGREVHKAGVRFSLTGCRWDPKTAPPRGGVRGRGGGIWGVLTHTAVQACQKSGQAEWPAKQRDGKQSAVSFCGQGMGGEHCDSAHFTDPGPGAHPVLA